MKTTTDTLGFLVHDAARLLRKRFEARSGVHGLSAAQWRLLVIVSKQEGVPQARLAEVLEIEPISVSRLIDRMEQGGWITRRSSDADRRVRMIYPTGKSREVFAAMKSAAGEVYEEAMAGLDAQQRSAMMNGLAAVVKNLSADISAEPVPERVQS
jgi:MarR family transcriptional regulator, transcriptional regulator for hemolysin